MAKNSPITAILQPTNCCATGKPLTETAYGCPLKCGCVISSTEVEKIASDTGFIQCPICELAYVAKNKKVLLTPSEVTSAHVDAQMKRLQYFEQQIQQIESEILYMNEAGDALIPDDSSDEELAMLSQQNVDYNEEEWKLIQSSDTSDVSDDSWDEGDDFLSFDSTVLAKYYQRMKNLKAKRDSLALKKANLIKVGEKQGAKWISDSYKPKPTSLKVKFVTVRAAQRMRLRMEAAKRREARMLRLGSAQVVHNPDVLGKNVPKKWREANPNVGKTPEQELKEREKKGWLNEEEQELDEEAQEALKAQRIAEFKKSQGPVPKIRGSVRRVRLAVRLFNNAKRQHLLRSTVAAFQEEAAKGDAKHADLVIRWTNKLEKQQARVEKTRAQVKAIVTVMEAKKKFELAVKTKAYFDEAERCGEETLQAVLDAKRLAQEQKLAREKADKKAAKKEAKKAARKKAAEEAGEDFDDEKEVSSDPDTE